MRMIALLIAALFMLGAAPSEDGLYHYRANVVSVYDGDTVTVDLDLGLKFWVRGAKLRLYGINTPEVRGEEKPLGLKARDFLRAMLSDHEVVVETIKDKTGKYGRWLAILWVKGKGGWCPKDQWCDANAHLVKTGHAVERFY